MIAVLKHSFVSNRAKWFRLGRLRVVFFPDAEKGWFVARGVNGMQVGLGRAGVTIFVE